MINSGVSWLKWEDKRVVTLLSNRHDTSKTGNIYRRNKQNVREIITCPEIIIDYNSYMDGVDKADQKKSCYQTDRKSKKNWPRQFLHFVDVSIVKAHIL